LKFHVKFFSSLLFHGSFHSCRESHTRYLISIAALLLLSSVLLSQSYPFKFYSASDGLFPATVNAIFQDRQGFIWFGGAGGISKYDGLDFHQHLTGDGLFPYVTSINEDTSGSIWISTEGLGIAKLTESKNKLTWLTKANYGLPSDSVYCVFFDREQNCWIGTSEGILLVRKDGSAENITNGDGQRNGIVRGFIQGKDGFIYSAVGGVSRYLIGSNGKILEEKISNKKTLGTGLTNDGRPLWASEPFLETKFRGVYSYKDNKIIREISLNNFPPPIKIQSILSDDEGNIWIGSTRGIYLKSKYGISSIKRQNGLVNVNIAKIFQDREKSIWIATGNGVMKLNKRGCISYNETHGLSGSGLLTAFKDNSGVVWFGGWSGAYSINKLGVLENPGKQSLLSRLQVHSINQTVSGDILFGTYGGFLIRRNGAVSQPLKGQPDAPFSVWAIEVDESGTIWIGSEGRILRIKGYKIDRIYSGNDGIPKDAVACLKLDKKARLWFGTGGEGVGFITNKGTKLFDLADPQSNSIECLEEDHTGKIWAATRKGVFYYEEKNRVFLQLKEAEFLGQPVFYVKEDTKRNLWFGTWNGLFLWKDSIVAHFDARNGLISNDVQSIAEDDDNNIWLATGGGITKLSPAARNQKIPAPIVWLELVGETASKPQGRSVEIPYLQKAVTFRINAPNYYDERNIEFQYKLSGLNSVWIDAGGQRILSFNSLDPGNYSLKVRARYYMGKWSYSKSYHFEVTPPFWLTWWFRLLIFLALITIPVIIYEQRILKLKHEKAAQSGFSKKLLESQENERKRIASELHDSVGQNLILLKNRAILGIRDQEKSKMQLEEIMNLSTETIAEVRSIAYNLRPYQLGKIGLTKAIESLIENTRECSEINIDSNIENIDGVVSDDNEIHLYRIIQECVSNTLKHSRATLLSIILRKNEEGLIFDCIDNGVGFQSSQNTGTNSGLGITNLSERVSLLGGNIEIISSLGKGVSIKIKIPSEEKT